MRPVLAAFSPQIYAVMRIVVGFLFLCHGAQKLFGAFGAEATTLASLRGVAGIIEFFGGLLIAVGLFGPVVAFIASGEMAAAYFISHFPQGFWPIQNRGELAVFYCFVFLYMASRDSGIWSVDAMRGRPSA